jgi:hypothetical protein
MEQTLAAFAASGAPLADRLRVARELAIAVAHLHARGRIHGALSPERALLPAHGAVVLAPPPADEGPLARAGFDAPEVARGRRPTRSSDAFSLGALAWLVLAGRSPFEGPDPLERIRRALFVEPGPVRLAAPETPLEVEAAIAAAMEKRPNRRTTAARLAEALGAAVEPEGRRPRNGAPGPAATPIATAAPIATATPTATPTPTPTATATPTATPTPTPTPTPTAAPTPTVVRIPSTIAAAIRRQLPTFLSAARAVASRARAVLCRLTPLQRGALVLAPLVALGVFALPQSDAVLEREIAAMIARGDLAAARRRLEASAKERPGDAVVEKLRGDVACARGEPADCMRRYRVALAKRPDLRQDPVLRANARRLLRPSEACGTRRAAANLVGELRDPEALPALEEARRSAGILAYFCTGDSIERAIVATRAAR